MGILNGLRGGEAIYLTAPLLQYEKLQRPEELRLPAGGGRQASSASNKDPEISEFLPGDSNFLSMQKVAIESLESKISNGEISDAEMDKYIQLIVTGKLVCLGLTLAIHKVRLINGLSIIHRHL